MQQLANGQLGALGDALRSLSRAAAELHRARHARRPRRRRPCCTRPSWPPPRAPSRYDGRSSCRPWLIGIAAQLLRRRRHALPSLRRRPRRASRARSSQPVTRAPPCRRARDLERALARLSEPKRITLLMAEVEGLSCAEIADALARSNRHRLDAPARRSPRAPPSPRPRRRKVAQAMTSAMKPACPRLFEVEALRDGRLAGAEVTRFRAHVGVCPVCARRSRKPSKPSPDATLCYARHADELHVRRERTALARGLRRGLVPACTQPLDTLVLGRRSRRAVVASRSASFSRARVPDSTAARPPRRSRSPSRAVAPRAARGGREGRSSTSKGRPPKWHPLDSRPSRTALRVLVVLPDGELEDIGTTFSVSADGGPHDARQRPGGQCRPPPPRCSAARCSVPATPGPGTSAPSTAPSAPDAASPPADSTTFRAPAPMPAPVASVPPPNASADFRMAVSALNSGNDAAAAALFASFLLDHPSNPRIEDAAYLRVLALHRSGNQSATERAAGEYLRRFPHGFRRTEVKALKP